MGFATSWNQFDLRIVVAGPPRYVRRQGGTELKLALRCGIVSGSSIDVPEQHQAFESVPSTQIEVTLGIEYGEIG